MVLNEEGVVFHFTKTASANPSSMSLSSTSDLSHGLIPTRSASRCPAVSSIYLSALLQVLAKNLVKTFQGKIELLLFCLLVYFEVENELKKNHQFCVFVVFSVLKKLFQILI